MQGPDLSPAATARMRLNPQRVIVSIGHYCPIVNWCFIAQEKSPQNSLQNGGVLHQFAIGDSAIAALSREIH
jgi:hypothetical protein